MSKMLKGLSTEEITASLQKYGDNSLIKEKKKSIFKRFYDNLSDPIIRILLLALVLQVVFSFGNINYFELGGILAAILLSTLVSTFSEFGSERAFERLSEESEISYVNVLRNGKITRLSVSHLVVGDIVYLFSGEKVPADGTLIDGKLVVDQSALNGESADYTKTAGIDNSWELTSRSRVFRGSSITEGSGIMRVERVGCSTYYGMVARDVQIETRESPLKLRLGRLASQISKIGYIVALIVGITYLFNKIVVDNSFESDRIIKVLTDFQALLPTLLQALTLMITVVVVAAPEGLPMMITVVLSANMKGMLKDNILVKKLVGIETAGSLNILFTDKTGTLTEGKMTCERIITSSGIYKGIRSLKQSGKIFENLNLNAKYNTEVTMIENQITGGNATDRAIYAFFANEPCAQHYIASKAPFNSQRKESSVSFKTGKTIIKGAAEVILSSSKYMMLENGSKMPINESFFKRELFESQSKGERAIAVAIKELNDDGLTLVGIITIKDKIRDGVRGAVNKMHRAGIQVVMVTGDGKETASAIAEDCGILNKAAGHIVLSSNEMEQITDEELKSILPKVRVVSRALPQDKTRLVRIAQELNLVTGMTGDGINDAPSLKLSDVGFAMGSGTEISKSASDIVLLDNSFFAISKTVLYGRTIFKSIRKFITFQLIMNLAACGISLLGPFIGVDTPITIIQMLWVNIIMDTLGGLAFAGEPALEYYMNEKPKKRDEPILSGEMLNQIFLSGAFTLFTCIVFLSSPIIRSIYGNDLTNFKLFTAFYALFVFLGIFNCICARCERLWILSNISKNIPFVFIMLLISMIQICMIYYGGNVFRCVPLLPQELSFAISISLSVVPFEMIRRFVYKLK